MIRFIAVFRCACCKHILTHNQRFNSMGVCPFCGENSRGTIVDSITESVPVEIKPGIFDRIWEWISK